jgi:hypothetical protein
MFRTDDNFPDCEKVAELDLQYPKLADSCIRLWLFGGCHSARIGTDGVIKKATVLKLTPQKKRALLCARALVSVGLWEEVEGGYRYHDWADWNELKIDKQKRLWGNAQRQKRYRERQSNDVSNGDSNASRNASVTPSNTNTSTNTKSVLSAPDPTKWREEKEITGFTVYRCLQDLCSFQADYNYHKTHLESVARLCSATDNPIGTLERIVKKKQEEATSRQQRVDPKWLATDFDRLSVEVKAPPQKRRQWEQYDEIKNKERLQRLQQHTYPKIVEAIKAAKVDGDAEQVAHHQGNLARCVEEIGDLGGDVQRYQA